MKNFILANLLCCAVFCFAQTKNNHEQVSLNINSQELISGETLRFAATISSRITAEPSHLSSILYVMLTNEEGEIIHQQKCAITESKAEGSIFVSSLISTGTYKLVAFTRWMRNFDDYSEVPITIINPFEPNRFATKDSLMLSIQPRSGSYINNANNTVDWNISGIQQDEISTVRIVNSQNETVQQFDSESKTKGSFIFTPQSNETYQAIWTHSGKNMIFIPITTKSGAAIEVTSKNDYWEVNLVASSQKTYEIFVSTHQELIPFGKISNGKPIEIPHETGYGASLLILLKTEEGETIDKKTVQRSVAAESLTISNFEKTQPTRSEATFDITSATDANLTITVERVPFLPKTEIEPIWPWSSETASNQMTWWPDARGEIISGMVQSDQKPTSVTISRMGEKNYTQTVSIDSLQRFNAILPPVYENSVIQLQTDSDATASFLIDNQFPEKYTPFTTAPLRIDSATAQKIGAYSVYLQLMNAYAKNESAEAPSYFEQFSDFDFAYHLDDYNRFKTLTEHFIEYIPTVALRGEGENARFRVKPKYYLPMENQPLVLLDGLPINANRAKNINPYLLSDIMVFNNQVLVNGTPQDGLVFLQSKDQRLYEKYMSENVIKWTGISPSVLPEKPAMIEKEEQHLPDYRSELLWLPDFSVKANAQTSIKFYTGDLKGQFVLSISGQTADGRPIHSDILFAVN